MNDIIEKKIDEYLESFLTLLKESRVPEKNTIVAFMRKNKINDPIFIFPSEKEKADEFMLRAHSLRKEFNPEISLVMNRNEIKDGDGRITIAYNDSKNYRMFVKKDGNSDIIEGWEETFEV